MKREPQQVVAGEAKEREGKKMTEEKEDVEAEASKEEGVVVVSEGEGMKYNNRQRNFLHDLILWTKNLFLQLLEELVIL